VAPDRRVHPRGLGPVVEFVVEAIEIKGKDE